MTRAQAMQITKNWRKCLLRYSLFIQYQGYVRKMKRGKAFMACGMGGRSIFLDFFACINSIIAVYRFSVSWILRFIVAAFLLQVANPKLEFATTGLGNQQSNCYQQWYE